MKLVKESIEFDSTVSVEDLYIVCREDLSDINKVEEIYTSVDDARPHASFLNSQAYKNNKKANFTFWTIGDVIRDLTEK